VLGKKKDPRQRERKNLLNMKKKKPKSSNQIGKKALLQEKKIAI